MATIPSTTNQLRHVRKTITFTGGAGAGAVGTVTVFTSTGAVQLVALWARCLTDLEDTVDGAEFKVGWVSLPEAVFDGTTGSGGALNLDDVNANQWLYGALQAGIGGVQGYGTNLCKTDAVDNGSIELAIANDDIIITISGQAITSGVLVFDCFYRPISDDGALAGDDIDAGYTPVDVKAWLAQAVAAVSVNGVPEVDVTHWLGTAAATPTVAGVPEVDVTHNAGTAITSASGIQEVKVASIAAAAITAAAIATDAIDADALAADAVTEIWAKAMSDLAAVPGATDSVLAGINWLFELARNKRTQTATTETIYKDDTTTALATSTKGDSSGTFTRGEYS